MDENGNFRNLQDITSLEDKRKAGIYQVQGSVSSLSVIDVLI